MFYEVFILRERGIKLAPNVARSLHLAGRSMNHVWWNKCMEEDIVAGIKATNAAGGE